MGDSKELLISFYNTNFQETDKHDAHTDWYDALDIYSLTVYVGLIGNLYAEISVGDYWVRDHILNMKIKHDKISDMNYDG